jgi:soluble lytic murein transglycosylase
MKQNYLATNIPVQWYSLLAIAALVVTVTITASSSVATGAPKGKTTKRAANSAPQSTGLAALVRAYRDHPNTIHRQALQSYAAAHENEVSGGLARLALGIVAYGQREYFATIDALKPVAARLPRLADYAGYYLAAARLESNDLAGLDQDLAPTHHSDVLSPFAGKAWILQARALKTSDAAAAGQLLRDHYAELPQPEGDLALADCYQATRDWALAAGLYQRIYYQFFTGDAQARADGALQTLKEIMGASYPQPSPQQMLARAGHLLDVHQYAQARAAYQSLAEQLSGMEATQARVRIGVTDYLDGQVGAAWRYFRDLDVGESEADAERLYYLEECARRAGDDNEIKSAIAKLASSYPQSAWRLKALLAAADRFFVANRPEEYVSLYQAVYKDFPADPAAGLSHWRVAFHAYIARESDAGDLIREQLRNYPGQQPTGAALYFLARLAESAQDPGSARLYYALLAEAFPNQYYAGLARQRLLLADVGQAEPSESAAEFLADISIDRRDPLPDQPTASTTERIERSRLLRTAGLSDLADSELRFGSKTDGQSWLLGIEKAVTADSAFQALRDMKAFGGGYLNLPLDRAPRKYWELLFPLPYREDVERSARERNLDPFLVAGLIRQESEFNPRALSRAKAYGLTQVQPATGRLYASQLGIKRFSASLLYQPATNLKFGASVLRSVVNQNGGNLEQALAAYNAGPTRVRDWLTWNTYQEPAEFVESIPFDETREYVQAVLRNADVYRRLYSAPDENPHMAGGSAAPAGGAAALSALAK